MSAECIYGSVAVRCHCVTGNLWPVVVHESMTGHLPHSCLEMKMNKLSVERTDPKMKQNTRRSYCKHTQSSGR